MTDVIKLFVPFLVIVALVAFIWGVVQYVIAGGDANKKKEGRNLIIYGLIGLFVIVAVWGLVAVIGNTIGVQPGGTIQIPQFSI